MEACKARVGSVTRASGTLAHQSTESHLSKQTAAADAAAKRAEMAAKILEDARQRLNDADGDQSIIKKQARRAVFVAEKVHDARASKNGRYESSGHEPKGSSGWHKGGTEYKGGTGDKRWQRLLLLTP